MTATIPRSAASVCISLNASEGGGFSYRNTCNHNVIFHETG